MSLTCSSFLFLPFMPSAIFRIPVFHTGLNFKGSKRDMALNMHIKSVKFEQTKPESTDSGISYIRQETKKNSLHIPVWNRQYFAKLTTEFTQEQLKKKCKLISHCSHVYHSLTKTEINTHGFYSFSHYSYNSFNMKFHAVLKL